MHASQMPEDGHIWSEDVINIYKTWTRWSKQHSTNNSCILSLVSHSIIKEMKRQTVEVSYNTVDFIFMLTFTLWRKYTVVFHFLSVFHMPHMFSICFFPPYPQVANPHENFCPYINNTFHSSFAWWSIHLCVHLFFLQNYWRDFVKIWYYGEDLHRKFSGKYNLGSCQLNIIPILHESHNMFS